LLKIYKILHCQTGKFYLNIYDFFVTYFVLAFLSQKNKSSVDNPFFLLYNIQYRVLQYRVLLCVDFEILSFTEGAL